MKKLITICLMTTLFCINSPTTFSGELTTNVPKYDQNEFNKPNNNDCIPTAIGMIFGRFYNKGRDALIPNTNIIPGVTNPPNWTTSNEESIKRLIEYQPCELNNSCSQDFLPSISKAVNYHLHDPSDGTSNADLARTMKKLFQTYDPDLKIIVECEVFDGNDEIGFVQKLRDSINRDMPVLFFATAGLHYWEYTGTTTPNNTTGLTGYTSGGNHASVVTEYNSDIFRLNYGASGNKEQVLIDASNNFGYTWTDPSEQKVIAFFFYENEEADKIGIFDTTTNDGWFYSDNFVRSESFVNAFCRGGREEILGTPWEITPHNGKVHAWPDNGQSIPEFDESGNPTSNSLWIQDLLKDNGDGTYTWNWLVYNPNKEFAHAVKDGFVQAYFTTAIGAPKTAETTGTDPEDNATIRIQPFENLACHIGIKIVNNQNEVDYYIDQTNNIYIKASDAIETFINNHDDYPGAINISPPIEVITYNTGRTLERRFKHNENYYTAQYNLITGGQPVISPVAKSTPRKNFNILHTYDGDGDGTIERILVHSSDTARNFKIHISQIGGANKQKEIVFPPSKFRPSWITLVDDKNNTGTQEICVHGRTSTGIEKSIFFDSKSGTLIP